MPISQENKALYFGISLILLIGLVTLVRPYVFRKSEGDAPNGPEKESTDPYTYITPDDLQDRISKKESLRIIDARAVSEFQLEHIFGSVNADQDTVDFYLKGLPADQMLVIVGSDPDDINAKVLADVLKSKGYSNTSILSGGMLAWTAARNRTIRLGNPGSLTDQAKISILTPDELKKLLDSKASVLILDLRSPGSFAEGHLPGAVNINATELEQRSGEIPNGKQLIYYAQSEMETFQYGVTLFDLGFLNSRALEGGISAWRMKEYPVEK